MQQLGELTLLYRTSNINKKDGYVKYPSKKKCTDSFINCPNKKQRKKYKVFKPVPIY